MTKLICGRLENRSAGAMRSLLAAAAIILACSLPGPAQTAGTTSSSTSSDVSAARTNPRATETPSDAGAVAYVNRGNRVGAERRVFVRSKSLLVRAAVVEDKLLKRSEFHELGFVVTRDESSADLILELRHDLFTKYVFTVVDTRTQEVVAGGKLSSLGGTVAGKVAKRFMKEIVLVKSP